LFYKLLKRPFLIGETGVRDRRQLFSQLPITSVLANQNYKPNMLRIAGGTILASIALSMPLRAKEVCDALPIGRRFPSYESARQTNSVVMQRGDTATECIERQLGVV
jgi:hypothetical protein